MSDDLLIEERADGVVWLTLNRPAARNALTWDLGARLRDAVESAHDARCIVITGAGSAFCAGVDLPMLRDLLASPRAETIRDHVYSAFQGMIRAVVGSPVPVIAAVNGPAMGVGADLVLACDIRVASERAAFEETWIRLGAISALGGAYALPRLVGLATAADLLLTATRVDADTGHRLGIFQRVAPVAGFVDEVERVGRGIATADPDATRAMKRLLRPPAELDRYLAALADGLAEQVPLLLRPQVVRRIDELLGTAVAATKGAGR